MAKDTQQSLFSNAPAPQTKQCVRCAKRCHVVDNRNPNANVFVKGTMETGRFCTECLVVDFFKNFELGPASALGAHYFDPSLPQPEYDEGRPDKRFDPEMLRAPHIQQQMFAIIAAAQKQYGAELTFEEIDWDEVIANWHLPFPEKPKRGRKKK